MGKRLASKNSRQRDSASTWKAGLVYLTDNGLSPYASYMTSFNPVLGTDFYGKAYQPTKGKQLEAGIKVQPKGFDGFVTASVFELRQQNVQTLDPDNPLNRFQVGEIRSRGFELEATANVTRNFHMTASYTNSHLKVTRSSNAAELGHRPAGVPEQMASAWGRYKFTNGSLAGLGVGVGGRYIGSSKADAGNAIDVPSYLLWDLVVDFDFARFDSRWRGTSLALNVSNLTNKRYYDACSAANCSAGDDRRVLLSLKHAW